MVWDKRLSTDREREESQHPGPEGNGEERGEGKKAKEIIIRSTADDR